MRTIQEVGKEILTGNPQKLYIFLGTEYILKEKYLSFISQHYKGVFHEVESYVDFVQIIQGTSLIPLAPAGYIIRYDPTFIKQLSAIVVSEVLNLLADFDGTLIFIYERESDAKKLDRFLSNYTVTFTPVSPQLQHKYLTNDYSLLSDHILKTIIQLNHGYSIADKICIALTYCTDEALISEQTILSTFLSSHNSTITQLQVSFADKNYYRMSSIIDHIPDLQGIHYKLLSVLIELFKVRKSSRIESKYKSYAPKWSNTDLVNMFDIVYNEIIILRTKSSDMYNSILYIATLLCYKSVPKLV